MNQFKYGTKDRKKKNAQPLVFRLYQSVRFNRPVDREKDFVSPGGYEVVMKDKDGKAKNVQFDFENYEGTIDENDPCVVHCMQKNPDYASFEGLKDVSEYMLRHVTDIVEWFIYTGEFGEQKDALVPVEAFGIEFELISDEKVTKIPVRDKIDLENLN